MLAKRDPFRGKIIGPKLKLRRGKLQNKSFKVTDRLQARDRNGTRRIPSTLLPFTPMPFIRSHLLIFSIAVAMVGWARAEWTYELLQSFEKPGANSVAPLALHSDGLFYGTTTSGGANDNGTIFRFSAGVVETLFQFETSDGVGPIAALTSAPGDLLFGTTSAGGSSGFGTIFTIDSAGNFTKLVDFTGTNGSIPGPLLLHSDGFLYGTTQAGGANGLGTIFKLSTSGSLTTIASFTGTGGLNKGAEPVGRLCPLGNMLFGLTRRGGASNLGTAFRMTTSGGFSSLVDFTGNAGTHPGANPSGGLILHSNGKLYGTAEFGGTNGFGSCFSLTTAASPGFSVLHHFSDPTGSQPAGELAEGSDQNLYGSAATGGSAGIGGLFSISPTGTHTLLKSFIGLDGSAPRAGLTTDASGLFFGITSAGGPAELGSIFSISTSGTFSSVANLSPPLGWMPSGAPSSNGLGGIVFPLAHGGSSGGGTVLTWDGLLLSPSPLGHTLGDQPTGSLLLENGTLFGLAARGSSLARGSAFSFTPGGAPALVNAFNTSGGSLPEGPLVAGPDALYGIAREGGATSRGTIFRVTPAGVRTRITSFSGTAGAAPGRTPRGPLAFAGNQFFYGVTEIGGSSNLGVLYKVNSSGSYTVLAEFTQTGPRLPQGGLVLAANGLVYGSTSRGGTFDAGTLIRIDPSNDSWSVVASFDPAIGASPRGELHAAPDGAILGFATSGGAENAGAIFRYHPSTGLEIISTLSGKLGAAPGIASAIDESTLNFTAGLHALPSGEILGLASGGGPDGGGVFFKLNPRWTNLQAWKLEYLGDSNAIDTDDPDHDGLANLIEFYLHTLPNVPDREALPLPEFVSGALQITVPRDPTQPELTITVEATTDLSGPWQALASSQNGGLLLGPGYISGENDDPNPKAVLIRDTLTPQGVARRFIRIRIEN